MKIARTSFCDQLLVMLALFLGIATSFGMVIAGLLYRLRIWNFAGTAMILLVMLIIEAVGILLFRKKLLLPYYRCRKKFKGFGEGLLYDELFLEDYMIFPEMRAVLKRFHNMLDKQSAAKISTKQAEYLALQNQINPHFLYNTLDAIRGDALSAGKADIADIAQALSKFFRYTITETGNLVTLEDELENAENYFTIQEYRFGDKLKMLVKLPEEQRDILRLQIPKLTLQPVIENAIFHGLERKAEGGRVMIHAEITERKLYISISDDGVGISEAQLEYINARLERVSASYVNEDKDKLGGIALKNVCRRIKLLFGEEYGVHIFSLAGVGTDVRIVMPLIWPGDIEHEERIIGD